MWTIKSKSSDDTGNQCFSTPLFKMWEIILVNLVTNRYEL